MVTTALTLEGRPRRKIGAPTKMTPAVRNRLIQAISAGNYIRPACEYAGIHYTTHRLWMVRGEEALAAVSRRRADQPYIEYFEAISAAEVESEIGAVAQLRSHFPNHPGAIQWWLERRHRDRWAPARQVDAEGKTADGNIAIALVQGGPNLFDRTVALALAREAMQLPEGSEE